jgi:hypothetical protein
MQSSIATVIYLNKKLHSEVKQQADKKFDKPSYVKSLWILKTYKDKGGKVRYEGGKPPKEDIKKAVASENFNQRGFHLTASLTWDQYEEDTLEFSAAEFETLEGLKPAEGERDKVEEYALAYLEDNKESMLLDNEELTLDLEKFAEEDSSEYLSLAKEERRKLNKPFRTPGASRKYAVYVKNPKTGKVVIVRFGDPDMPVGRHDPKRRKSFRARHRCDQQKDKLSPAHWSCRMWSKKPVSKIVGAV